MDEQRVVHTNSAQCGEDPASGVVVHFVCVHRVDVFARRGADTFVVTLYDYFTQSQNDSLRTLRESAALNSVVI